MSLRYPEISSFEICYSSFFKTCKKAEENAPTKLWSPRGESLETTPIFLTTPTSPSVCNHASYHRVQIETLPFCCPFPSLSFPSPHHPRPISPVPACSSENYVVVPREYIQDGGCFQALLPISAAHVGASASFISLVHTRHALSLFHGVIVFPRNGLRTCTHAGATLAFSRPRGRLES